MVRTKVFVGNLDFKTKESELAQEFAAAGTVISANIITRGPRSLGYGFVELDSEQSAENAVKNLNKKKVNGREINVELAKERPEGLPSRSHEGGAPRRRYRRFRRPYASENNDAENNNTGNGSAPPRRRFRRPRPRNQNQEEGQAPPPRQPRVPRRRNIEERNHTPSKTTLFVANLPFALDDVEFGQVFKEEGLAYKSAHVVKKRNQRSKGFGFVEFDNEGDQQKALQKVNNKSVLGRELIVKVALTEQKHRDDSNAPKEESKQEKPVETKKEEKKAPEPKKEEKKTTAQTESPKKEEKVQEKKSPAEEKKPEPKKEEKKPEPKKDDTKPAEKNPEPKKEDTKPAEKKPDAKKKPEPKTDK